MQCLRTVGFDQLESSGNISGAFILNSLELAVKKTIKFDDKDPGHTV